jgi:magnesium chelatase accessory protein
MMAHWDLEPLRADLPRLTVPMTLLAGDLDRAVRPEEAAEIAALVPHAQVVALPGLGHLAHEEAPERVAAEILRVARESGLPFA